MTSEQLREIEERHIRLSESMDLIRSCGGIHFDAEATEYVVNKLFTLISEIRRLRHIALECECNPLGVEPLCVYAKANMGSGLPVDAREGESHPDIVPREKTPPRASEGRSCASYDEAIDRIGSLTKAQRGALDRLCTGGNPGVNTKTLAKLESLGLIQGYERHSNDALGRFTWREYDVPIPVHMAWCAIASAEFDALSPEEQAAMEAPE